MKLTSVALLVLLLSAFATCQMVDLTQIFTPATLATLGPQYQDPTFLRTIDNYFGCKTWKDGFCVACSARYVFNNNGVCCQVDTNCEIFNRDVGVCEQCYNGFSVNAAGTCTAHSPSDPIFAGCSETVNNVCQKCSAKWFFDANGVCQAVNAQCREWNTQDGTCSTCYFGYVISNGACIVDPTAPGSAEVAANPNCKEFGANGCVVCANRAYFDANGVCQLVSNHCNTWDNADGLCLSCYSGYDLANGACSLSPSNNAAPTDLGCKTWEAGICIECSLRWVFNANGVCVPVNDACRTHDSNGVCLTCYAGYDLSNGVCVFSPSNNQAPTDGGCADWDWNNQICLKCSSNWVADVNGLCVPVSDACRTHDANGACTGCFKGYDLVNGACVFSPSNNQGPTMPGCKIWNWDAQTCQQCSAWWFSDSNGICTEVSALCATHDVNGACLTCFSGYVLNNGVCSPAPILPPSDAGCHLWNGAVCEACSNNWVFNGNGVCVPVSDQCRTHDLSNGWCTACYAGYDLTNVNDANNNIIDVTCNFSPSNTASPADLGCKTWEAGVCTVCSNNWFFVNGACQPVSDLCKSHEASNGFCLSCYPGYDLTDVLDANANIIGVTCNFSPSNNAAPTDLGCKTWEAGICIECSLRWVFNANGVCVPVNDACRTHDSNGVCLTCYAGYDLSNGVCVFSPSNNQAPTDGGCADWDWNNQICLKCSSNWVADVNGLCVPVSDACRTHDANGACTGCFKGYDLVNGACVFSPSNNQGPTMPGCKIWNWDAQTCQQCSAWWFSDSNGICTEVSALCATHDVNGACLTCFSGYVLNNGVCSPAPILPPSDAGCHLWNGAVCEACSNNWVFNGNGVCVPVSDQCRTHDLSNGWCTACYAGYDLTNVNDANNNIIDVTCNFSPSNTASPADLGCKTWEAGVCTVCSNNWFFVNGACQPVSDLCKSHEASNGFCLSCYPGYDLTDVLDANANIIGVTCNFSPSNNAAPTDLGCKTWEAGICIECSLRWVFNANGVCVPVNDACRTHDSNGVCLTCYAGYDLSNGVCVFSPSNNQAPTDGGCADWDWNNQICLKCSSNWVADVNGLCVPVSDACRTHDANGACTGCFKGYDLVNGACVFSPSNNQGPTMPGCKIWNWDAQTCQQCSAWWFSDSNGICTEVSALCATHDVNGACLTCFSGYVLNNGVCSPAPILPPSDAGCHLWNGAVCEACSNNWVFNGNGVCVPVSDQCRTHDLSNGWCTACYAGYDLTNVNDANNNIIDVTCNFSPSNTASPADLGCKTWEAGVCTVCSNNWFFVNGACQPVSDLCKSHEASNGFCLSCYPGYDLTDVLDANANIIGVTCNFSPSNNAAPTDLGCKTWEAGVCTVCSNNWSFDANNKCQPVSDNCKTHVGLLCQSCYNGFVLNNGVCELSPFNSQIPTDAGCSNWDWNNQVCNSCSNYWFFDVNGVCVPVNPLCKTYDNANGNCLTCWKGYSLNANNGACERNPDQVVSDAGCSQWNWDAQTCLTCSNYWFFNNGVCSPVSAYCKTYDNVNGACLTCFSGYTLLNGECVVAVDNFCKTSDQTGCLTCYDGYVLYQNHCTPLNQISNIALYFAECCPEKLAQLRAEGRIPQ